MFRNMLGSLVEHERIVTTEPKAKELKRLADQVRSAGRLQVDGWMDAWMTQRLTAPNTTDCGLREEMGPSAGARGRPARGG